MHAADLFRGALEQLASVPIAFEDVPAFCDSATWPGRPARSPGRAPGSAAPASGGLSIVEAARRMGRGETTARQLVAESYERIEARAGALNAFTYVQPQAEAESEAARLDDERRRGQLRGSLHGIPLSVKDVIRVRGMPTTASSKVMDGREEPEDAEAVARLRAAGAIFLGKTSTHEFALGVTTPQSRNPWDPERLPGGSSGGSAIAVASGMGLGSLGTDTRASIRVPAALCGVVGLKPTFGLVPTRGMVTLSWSMDHVAPIAKTAEDAGLLLEVLAGSRSGVRGETGTDAALAAVRAAGSDLRIGVPLAARRENHAAVALAFDEALGVLRGLGSNVVDVDEPNGEDFALANAAGLIVSRVEAAAYHEPWRGRRADYTDDVRGQLDEARKATGVAYVQAQRYRSRLSRQMLHLFDRFDLLAMPTCKIPAPYPEESDEMLLVLSETCIPWSFIGFPAISLPCGAAPGNLPIGLELVAAPNADALLLAVAAAFESAAAVSYV